MEISQTVDLQLKELEDLYKKLVTDYNSLGQAAQAIASGVKQKQFSLAVLKQLEPLAEQIMSIAPPCRKELLSARNFFQRLKVEQEKVVSSNANTNSSEQVKSLIDRLSPFAIDIEDLLEKIKDAGVTWQDPQPEPS